MNIMNTSMRIFSLSLFLVFFVFGFAHAVFAAIVINEVLFNPSGSSDTGLEKIELYNNSGEVSSMGGWELYADKAGYFLFPAAFSIPARGFVTVHLRSSGTNDAKNLYHAGADNMGDSSGSVVLFSAAGHPKDSLTDFVRYQKSSSAESKTWESAASSKKLWETGTFVDVTTLSVGESIALLYDGVRGSAGSWRTASATIGLKNDTVVPPSNPERSAPSMDVRIPAAPLSSQRQKDELQSATQVSGSGISDSMGSPETLAAVRSVDSWGYFLGAFLLSLAAAGAFLFYRSRQTF